MLSVASGHVTIFGRKNLFVLNTHAKIAIILNILMTWKHEKQTNTGYT